MVIFDRDVKTGQNQLVLLKLSIFLTVVEDIHCFEKAFGRFKHYYTLNQFNQIIIQQE